MGHEIQCLEIPKQYTCTFFTELNTSRTDDSQNDSWQMR